MNKTKKNIKKIIIIILIILNIIFIANNMYIKVSYSKYKVKEYPRIILNIPEINIKLTKNEAKKLIKTKYKTFHFYKEKNLNNANGRSIILLRIIEINKNLDILTYIITYTHELTHIKYNTANETFVSYKTFIMLYESGNADFKYCALKYAQEILIGAWSGTDYDCGYYIYKYLQKEGLITT